MDKENMMNRSTVNPQIFGAKLSFVPSGRPLNMSSACSRPATRRRQSLKAIPGCRIAESQARHHPIGSSGTIQLMGGHRSGADRPCGAATLTASEGSCRSSQSPRPPPSNDSCRR